VRGVSPQGVSVALYSNCSESPCATWQGTRVGHLALLLLLSWDFSLLDFVFGTVPLRGNGFEKHESVKICRILVKILAHFPKISRQNDVSKTLCSKIDDSHVFIKKNLKVVWRAPVLPSILEHKRKYIEKSIRTKTRRRVRDSIDRIHYPTPNPY
jgi:hypothetical protein